MNHVLVFAAFMAAGCLYSTTPMAQEPPPMARHPFLATTWTASYVYDCVETFPSFDLAVTHDRLEVSNFDFGRGADAETDRRINQALAGQSFNDLSVACGLDGLGTSVVFRTYKAGSYAAAWVNISSTAVGPAKVTVAAGIVDSE